MEKHVRGQEESGSRAAYRRGKSPKAVKAFSIVKESRCRQLLVALHDFIHESIINRD